MVEYDEEHHRYVATQVKFTENKSVTYTKALIGNENINILNSGEYFGFNVDTGSCYNCGYTDQRSLLQLCRSMAKRKF